MNITKSVALLLLVVIPQGSHAAYKTYENTWFEIEVILFQQLDDKSILQEVFPETSALATSDKIIDIIGPALSPNIDNLKGRLPQCDNVTLKPQSLLSIKPLSWPTEIPAELFIDYAQLDLNVIAPPVFDEELDTTLDISPLSGEETLTPIETLTEVLPEPNTPLDTDELIELYTQVNNETHIEEVTEFIQQSTKINSFQFPATLCAIPEEYFEDYKKENPSFSYNSTPITKVPSLITGLEDLSTTEPYIISQESLQLTDITKQLKYSRNFRPLLHIGWRQITRLKEEAVPVKIYAGENLNLPYLSALKAYENTLKQNSINELSNINQITDNGDIQQNTEELIQRNKISEIINEVSNNTIDLQSVLAVMKGVDASPKYISSPLDSIDNDKVQPIKEPQKPPQNWTLEGLLKVEVERYLHITADFNIIDKTASELATEQLSTSEDVKLKSIKFQQNKRVRSNEIHYFDHPYMGMIVQIRRHEQIEPEESENLLDIGQASTDQ